MVIRLGNNAEPSKMYLGGDEIQKVYAGGVQVWPDTGSTSVTVEEVLVGVFANQALDVTLRASNVASGDTVYWVLTPDSDATPSAENVRFGLAAGGAAAIDSGSGVWPGPFSDTVLDGISETDVFLSVVIDNGTISNVVTSASFTIDTEAPILSGQNTTVNSAVVSWAVTSNEEGGTIYAAIRDASDSVLSEDNIINGSGNALENANDVTPTADGNNGSSFGPQTSGDYVVDIVQVDSFGNRSAVVSTGTATIAAVVGLTRSSVWSVEAERLFSGVGYRDFTVDLSTVADGDTLVLSLGSWGANVANSATLDGVAFTSRIDSSLNDSNRSAVLTIACPPGSAGTSATLRVLGADTFDNIWANLDHVEGVVSGVAVNSSVQAGSATGGVCSANIATTIGGLLYAVGASSSSNGVDSLDPDFTEILVNAVRSGDDSFILAADETTSNETRTVNYSFGGPGQAGFDGALAIAFISTS